MFHKKHAEEKRKLAIKHELKSNIRSNIITYLHIKYSFKKIYNLRITYIEVYII